MAALTYRSAQGRWVIGATVAGSAMAAIDGTVVSIALPSIGRQFHVPLVSVQWVVTAYLLMLASLLVVGGALGDLFGRRRMFLIGVVWFAAASAACAAAPNATTLVVTRAVQGAGAALLVPESLAILQASFAQGDRARAIGAWSGLGGVATAGGPLLGGLLIAAVSWRWIFVINVPVAVGVFVVARRHVPESRQPSAGRIDVPGAALLVVLLAGVTYGLVEGAPKGWTSPAVLAGLSTGAAAGLALLVTERRSRDPLLPPSLAHERQFVVTNAVTLLVYAGLGGALLLLPVALEVVDGYGPFEVGASLLPLTLLVLVLSAPSGGLAARIGPRLQMAVGPIVVAAGLALLARTTSDASYVSGLLPAVVVFGTGLGITVAPLTATALGSVSDAHAGLASAVNNDVSRVGGLVAVAVLPTLAGIGGSRYLHAAPMAHGFRTAVLITAAWCAAGGLLAAVGIRNPARPAARPRPAAALHCALDAAPLAAHGVDGRDWSRRRVGSRRERPAR